MRKRSFLTLIEVMIAMGLGIALLTSSLFFYRFAAVHNEELFRKEKEAFRYRVVQYKLNELFQRVSGKGEFFTKAEAPFSKGPIVILKAMNPPFDIPTFGGRVSQAIFVDSEGRLMLATWQNNMTRAEDALPDMHLEVLLEGAGGLDTRFLVKESDLAFVELRGGAWLSEWKGDYGQIPAAVKIRLGDKEYAFPVALEKGDG